MHPKVEIMMAMAIMAVPNPGKICCSMAVATRSAGACWMAGNGSTSRYATFVSK